MQYSAQSRHLDKSKNRYITRQFDGNESFKVKLNQTMQEFSKSHREQVTASSVNFNAPAHKKRHVIKLKKTTTNALASSGKQSDKEPWNISQNLERASSLDMTA